MRLSKHQAQVEMKLNMTPMIDVTFLLIIFFMLITDLSQQDLEELELPVAVQASRDEPDPTKVRPVVNVLASGAVIVKQVPLYDPALDDTGELERYLAEQAAFMIEQDDWEYLDPAQKSGPRVPDNPLLIRADKNTPFHRIQQIMALCGQENIRIWRVELAAAEDPLQAAEREAAERAGER